MIAATWLVGPRGRALAAGIAVLFVLLAWFGIAAPAWSWFEDRSLLLEQRQALLQRMRAVAASLPALKAESANRSGQGAVAGTTMLPAASDAVAAADLQERLQKMATNAGVSLTAVETLPATPVGNWHKVSLRISLNAPWPVLMDLLRSIEQSPTRILVDDVHFHSSVVVNHPASLPVQASMILYGFRPVDAGTGT
jgi:general secretion pathway protein M